MHYSLMEIMRVPILDSDLLYGGTLKGNVDCIAKLAHHV